MRFLFTLFLGLSLMISCQQEEGAKVESRSLAGSSSPSPLPLPSEEASGELLATPIDEVAEASFVGSSFSQTARGQKIQGILGGLLQGPCSAEAINAMEQLVQKAGEAITKVEQALAQETDPKKIQALEKLLDALKILKDKVQMRIDECKNGNSSCSQQFKDNLQKAIQKSEDKLKELEAKVAQAQGTQKQILEKQIELLKKAIVKMKDILSQC